mgnify:CR=1 FL=1
MTFPNRHGQNARMMVYCPQVGRIYLCTGTTVASPSSHDCAETREFPSSAFTVIFLERWKKNEENVKGYTEFLESDEYKNSPLKTIRDKIKNYMIKNNYYEVALPLIRKMSPAYDDYYKKLLESNEKFLRQVDFKEYKI